MIENAVPASKVYKQLDKDDQIRLLTLSTTLSQGRIQCHLETVDLRSAQFVVLSYTWGTSPVTYEILLDGEVFRIRPNLWAFLDVIRQQEGILLWIDALCINQTDVSERNAQVSIMGNIFRSASMVVNWLGPPSLDSRIANAFEMMKSVWLSSDVHSSNEGDQLPQVAGSTEHEIWQGVVELCELAYWNRVWVVQEVLLASNNYLLYGEAALPWHMFANFLSLIDVRFRCPSQFGRIIQNSTARSYASSKPYTSVPQELTWRIGSALHDYGKWWNISEYNLFRILTMFGARECTEPLDHVYALLSLTYQGTSFPVRYGISLFELFLTAFYHCSEQTAKEELQEHVLEPMFQRALFRNARFLAETMQLLPVYHGRTQPYFPGAAVSTKGPSPRPDPCFPHERQSLLLQCSLVDPENEPPVLRSKTLRRSLADVSYDAIVHLDESSTWLLVCKTEDDSVWHAIAAVTIKDSAHGRGFKILSTGKLQQCQIITTRGGPLKMLKLIVPPEDHSALLEITILATQPS